MCRSLVFGNGFLNDEIEKILQKMPQNKEDHSEYFKNKIQKFIDGLKKSLYFVRQHDSDKETELKDATFQFSSVAGTRGTRVFVPGDTEFWSNDKKKNIDSCHDCFVSATKRLFSFFDKIDCPHMETLRPAQVELSSIFHSKCFKRISQLLL
ncbi:unnamed protein product [Caenorhabditis brenneri]